ncbi:MAG: hypothetical protein QMD92_00165 [bacterium]|nr:hypothetical protein [bacterium]
MRKINLQIRVTVAQLASLVKAIHFAGLAINRPADVVDVAIRVAEKMFNATDFPFTEEQAEEFLQRVGFHVPIQDEVKDALIAALNRRKNSQEELENLIESFGRT